ncbi:MAG: M23 family metallopeptidase [Oscillospiraceae bacterium]|jgi:murein DD-endopeptidase MepM/ murein hydrolase activator NlpD|nr:M23 family metallopeptidase [Oscillospiraceae bacterium]
MNEEFDSSERLGNKGFYIALLLCICVIAVSAWIIISTRGEEDAVLENDPQVYRPVMDLEDNEYDKIGDVISITEPDIVETLEPLPPEESGVVDLGDTMQAMTYTQPETPAAPAIYIWPVVGKIETPYSMDALVYNMTMSDWRVHDGIDINADAGAVVLAAAAGTVEDVFADDLFGTTVVIDHGSGLRSYYANLQAQPNVSVGDTVTAGQTIGAVGNTALCETSAPYHLHLSMSLDDKSVDPTDYLPKL